ncbi:tRNA dihydrouridine synthase DusB [Chromobacterium haemolyticum]|uniref:tRNA-dihydrouridine synthase B n=1 Tax=Chromobacterium fluminis TaxID=3044269 RepID=A0ABX0L8J1_9NEIS|nr:tRNA dihydrouridine synthase DusB [Chromobacterium haemolyticum]NHR03737.1 tRNA dihydrouridine synthase DusB [Chromobacterium haemolyticum]OQS43424.1 tRNA dihydrouridine synthase DusB [Chromobacterium haemolyticum]
MRIGSYTLKNRLIVAPMAGVTDRPFRMLCKQLGAGMAVSEMITSNKALWTTAKTLRRADHAGEVEPISVQIAGSDPAQMAEAARLNVERGAQIIDINMGCPAKKVCNVAAGSALLRDEALVGRILEAVVKAVDVPVTLKTRTGWSPEHRNALRVARLAEDCGIAALALHGRTREDMYRGAAEYDTIREVKRQIRIPLIANGDIDTPQKAQWVLEHTGADAIMIGRAAQGRPWIFREIQHFLDSGECLPPPEVSEIRQLLLGHLDELYQFYGEYSGCRIARKHIAWYTKGLQGGNAFRQQMYQLESTAEQRLAVAAYFDRLAGDSERLVYLDGAGEALDHDLETVVDG